MMSEENKNLNNSASESETKKTKKAKDKKSRRSFKEFMKSRKTKHGAIAIVIIAIVLAITILLNFICGLLVDRFPYLKFDTTANNAFALQEDTMEYVSDLDNEVKIHILTTKNNFEDGGQYFLQAENLLDRMVAESDGKLSLDYVDLTSNPNFTKSYENVDWTSTGDNLVLVESGKQYRALTVSDCFEYDAQYYSYYGIRQYTSTKIEQALVTAIVNVTTENKVLVDVITSSGTKGYEGVKSLLENNAYEVKEVSIDGENKLDEEAEIAILYAPGKDLSETAIEKLTTWLENDGKYGRNLFYVAYISPEETPNLNEFLSEWGMELGSGTVFETDSTRLLGKFAFSAEYAGDYTSSWDKSNIPVVVYQAHDVIIKNETNAHALLTTTESGGVYPVDADNSWKPSDGQTGKAVAVAAEGVKTGDDDKKSKVLVYGTGYVFGSNYLSATSFNNADYFMRVVNTLTNRDDVGITITGKDLSSEELGLTSVAPGEAVRIIFEFVVPVAILAFGVFVWVRRRNR